MKIKLGEKRKDICESKPCDVPELYYPSMYISDTQLPVDGEDVGKTFKAVVKLKVTGVNTNTNLHSDFFTYNFEVHEIEFLKDDK
jgi:hypothetical protein